MTDSKCHTRCPTNWNQLSETAVLRHYLDNILALPEQYLSRDKLNPSYKFFVAIYHYPNYRNTEI